jgi:outer membrane protein TolC
VKYNEPANLPVLFWWKQFGSLELDAFIQKALENNGQPKIAITNIEYARSQLEQVKLSWLPNLTALAGFSQFPVLGNPGGVAIAYPLYVVNILQLYKQQKSAQATYEASIYAKDCARLVVIAQTSASFFTLIAQKEALNLYHQLIKDYQTYLKLAQSQYHSGLTSLDDIEQLQSQMKQIQAQMNITRHNIVMSKNALHYLFNENPGNIQVTTSFKQLNSNAIIPGNLPVSVLDSRPDIRQAEALLRASHEDVGAVKANLLPTLTLGGYLGAGTSVGAIKLGEAYLTMPIVDLPLFAQISASKARYKESYIKYIVLVKKALRDVANDLSAYSAYSTQLDTNTSALKNEKRHCHLVARRYHHGLEDNIELIKCKIKVDQFELLINQNKLDKMIAIVNLYQDLAGGYHGT